MASKPIDIRYIRIGYYTEKSCIASYFSYQEANKTGFTNYSYLVGVKITFPNYENFIFSIQYGSGLKDRQTKVS